MTGREAGSVGGEDVGEYGVGIGKEPDSPRNAATEGAKAILSPKPHVLEPPPAGPRAKAPPAGSLGFSQVRIGYRSSGHIAEHGCFCPEEAERPPGQSRQ